MTIQRNQEIWQEYLKLEDSSYHRILSPGNVEALEQEGLESDLGIPITKLTPAERQELKIVHIAEQECKTRAQWRKEETENIIRTNAIGSLRHKSADECLERSRQKLQSAYNNEARIMSEIDNYRAIIHDKEKNIERLSRTGYKNRLRSEKNKLDHAKGCIIILERELVKKSIKTKFYDYLVMKWIGVNEKLKLAHINQEIREEKAGIGNKYGFNPKAQSRETAEMIFQD